MFDKYTVYLRHGELEASQRGGARQILQGIRHKIHPGHTDPRPWQAVAERYETCSLPDVWYYK